MDFVIIIALALGALIFARILFIFLYKLGENKAENKEKTEDKFTTIINQLNPIMYSLGCLGVFFVLWGIAVVFFGVPRQTDASLENLVWYVVFTFLGVVSIIWCYFRWDFDWKARPRFEVDKTVMALKKIIVFGVVMGFAFYYGYKQMDAKFNNVDVDNTLTIYNVTLISGIIALDRVLNQVSFVYKKWKDKQEERKSKKKTD